MKKILYIACAALLMLAGCKTVDFEKEVTVEKEAESEEKDIADKYAGKSVTDLKDEKQESDEEVTDMERQEYEKLSEIDLEKSIVYVEKPVYYPVEEQEKRPVGKDAARKSLDTAVQVPYKFSGGAMFYDFDETFVYEIYCQPYRITDLALEPGEMVLENPFISESQVWEMGAGVSRKNGQDVQHFYLKPDISGLTTSMIIITDRRVYHLLLKSFKDCYMAMVEFEYPGAMPYTVKTDAMVERLNSKTGSVSGFDPKYLSFDYKMTYSCFRKPLWLPKRVYDDGRRTYIQMDETVLHTQSPVVFNRKDERINYRVDKNLIIIDELIEKVTLRRGKEKVTIKKKNYVEEKPVVETEEQKKEAVEETKKLERKGYNLHAQFPTKSED